MKHEVDGAIDMNEVGDVVLDEREVVTREVRDIREVASQEIVDADNRTALVEQRVREVGSYEACRSRDDNPCVHRGEFTLCPEGEISCHRGW